MIQCCGEEMLISNGWYHCKTCHKRLVEIPEGQENRVLASMIVEHVQEYEMSWKEFHQIFHELWRQGFYDGYEPKVPDNWNTSLGT